VSSLAQPNGDDHPEAALNHLLCAEALLSQQRFDGAAYLSGYVVECSLKGLWLLEAGAATSGKKLWGTKGHNLSYLNAQVTALAAVAGAKTARYFGAATKSLLSAGIAAWTPEMRYRPATMRAGDAQAWCSEARAIFVETVAQMKLDGVL
jgi:hypothetical protein